MGNKRREGNVFTPFGNVVLCKTISEIKFPHLSIITWSNVRISLHISNSAAKYFFPSPPVKTHTRFHAKKFSVFSYQFAAEHFWNILTSYFLILNSNIYPGKPEPKLISEQACPAQTGINDFRSMPRLAMVRRFWHIKNQISLIIILKFLILTSNIYPDKPEPKLISEQACPAQTGINDFRSMPRLAMVTRRKYILSTSVHLYYF